MMFWSRDLTFETEIKDNNLHVTLTTNHVRGKQGFREETYTTQTVTDYLERENILFKDVLTETTVYNYQSDDRCTGTWIFSLPVRKKTPQVKKPLENKQNVTKINNKKTSKK